VFLVPVALLFAAILIAEDMLILYAVPIGAPRDNITDVGLTQSIGTGLFTYYLLPFEVTSILLLMAIVGAMTLARRATNVFALPLVAPSAQLAEDNDALDIGDVEITGADEQ